MMTAQLEDYMKQAKRRPRRKDGWLNICLAARTKDECHALLVSHFVERCAFRGSIYVRVGKDGTGRSIVRAAQVELGLFMLAGDDEGSFDVEQVFSIGSIAPVETNVISRRRR